MARQSLKRLVKYLNFPLVASIFAILLLSLAPWIFDGKEYYLELTSHFRLQYFVFCIVAAAIYLLGRHWLMSAVSLVAVFVTAIPLLPYLPIGAESLPVDVSKGAPLTFMVANVLTRNPNYEEVLDVFKKVEPDFLLLMEIDKSWDSKLKSLEGIYPHYHLHTREDNFGIGIFSKYPFEQIEIGPMEEGLVPTVVSKVAVEGQSITLLGAHPLPPVSPLQSTRRNRYLDFVGELAANTDDPLVLLGDLNVSMWSPVFRKLLKKSSLKDPREGRGVFPTWPRNIFPLLIPIDHILVSSEWLVSDSYQLEIPG